ncbi:wall-associated receptor kinase 3-like [Miscanthus floridulus]|uniref:wall-associated receptor kinase 3-like n=1 Tax=Miscanthus floridulus TaxID=154761 RepID=UPI003459C29A
MDCCQATLTAGTRPREVQAEWIHGRNHTAEQQLAPVNVFVAEEGWVDQSELVGAHELQEAPLLLKWKITRNLPRLDIYHYNETCSQDSSVSIPIIHRDIKSSNILLDDTMTSKISDFGASRYIPIDNTGLTTRIQGTFGYLDPECFQTGRLTEKSDVYSFGVIFVELLTRKKPTCSHLSNEYGGLVPHFLNLLASRNLDQIMDPQVLEEGGTEVQQVVMIAASCINIRGEERPTMRQVELTLEGLQQGSNKKYKKDDMVTEEFVNGSIGGYYPSGTSERQRPEESSRRYSLEQEMMMSARYPR